MYLLVRSGLLRELVYDQQNISIVFFNYENECYMRVMFVEGYIILMKGVVGVLGDMYQIWISLVIMNVNNLQVMYFINIFKGYYKIDLL